MSENTYDAIRSWAAENGRVEDMERYIEQDMRSRAAESSGSEGMEAAREAAALGDCLACMLPRELSDDIWDRVVDSFADDHESIAWRLTIFRFPQRSDRGVPMSSDGTIYPMDPCDVNGNYWHTRFSSTLHRTERLMSDIVPARSARRSNASDKKPVYYVSVLHVDGPQTRFPPLFIPNAPRTPENMLQEPPIVQLSGSVASYASQGLKTIMLDLPDPSELQWWENIVEPGLEASFGLSALRVLETACLYVAKPRVNYKGSWLAKFDASGKVSLIESLLSQSQYWYVRSQTSQAPLFRFGDTWDVGENWISVLEEKDAKKFTIRGDSGDEVTVVEWMCLDNVFNFQFGRPSIRARKQWLDGPSRSGELNALAKQMARVCEKELRHVRTISLVIPESDLNAC